MQLVLVSACLIGSPVRYDATDKLADSDVLRRWLTEGRVVSVCPELAGGLPVPRAPAEITGGDGGSAVLAGRARVIGAAGNEFTAQFVAGAQQALTLARSHGIRVAVLKEGSPSCGSHQIYDGSFSGKKLPGAGVTAALLRSAGLLVFSEDQFHEADAAVKALES